MSGLKGGIVLARRDAIECYLREHLPRGVHVTHHGGEIDLAELLKYGAKAPAVVVTCLRFGDTDRSEASVDVGFAVYAVTSSKKLDGHPDLDRHDQCLILAEAVTDLTMADDFAPATGCSDGPQDLVASNLYGRALDESGKAIWGMAWTESTSLAHDDYAQLFDLESIWTTILPTEDDGLQTPSIEWEALKEETG